MARGKKKMILENSDATPAAASLHPGAAPSDGGTYDPTKSEVLAQALAVLGGMSKDDINGFLASLTMTPSNAHVTDGNDGHNKATIMAKPSFAVGKPTIHEEDISALFEGQEVSEEFLGKAKNIFEAALETRLAIEVTNLQEQYETYIDEAYNVISEEMEDKLNQYLNYVISEWMEENELVIDRGVKSEIMESFVLGLKDLFAEHYVDIPEDQVDAVELLSAKVAELEAKLNSAIETNINLQEGIEISMRESILEAASHDLSEAATERLMVLSENVEFEHPDVFAQKVEKLKESVVTNNFRPRAKPTGILNEDVFLSQEELTEENNPGFADSTVAAAVQHISRTVKKA